MAIKTILSWIDQDLDKPRPLSLSLIMVPFLPFAAALGFGANDEVSSITLLFGFILAALWFFYAFVWRGFKRVVRSYNDTIDYNRRQRDRFDWVWYLSKGKSQINFTATIYMPLLDEDVEVWRPVQAQRIAKDVYKVTGEVPEDEQWLFLPGSKVRCADQRLSGGWNIVAVEKVG